MNRLLIVVAILLSGCSEKYSVDPKDIPTLDSVCAKHSKFNCSSEVSCGSKDVSTFVRWDGYTSIIALLHVTPTQLDRILTALEAK